MKSFGDRKVVRLNPNSVIRFRRVLGREQIDNFLVDKFAITPDVLVDNQAGCDSEETLYLVRALDALVRLQIMNRLE